MQYPANQPLSDNHATSVMPAFRIIFRIIGQLVYNLPIIPTNGESLQPHLTAIEFGHFIISYVMLVDIVDDLVHREICGGAHDF